MKGFRTILGTLVGVALVAGTAWSAFAIYESVFARGLKVRISAPDEIAAGAPFTAIVHFENDSSGVLKNMAVAITLPAGVAVLGASPDQRVVTQQVGDIGAGTLSQKEFQLIASGDPDTSVSLEARVSYESLSSRFEKTTRKDVTLRQSGVPITITVPETVFSGNEFDMTIGYKNASNEEISDLELRLELPPTFAIKRSTIAPDEGIAAWRLGSLRPGSEGTLKITGSFVGGGDGASFDVRAVLSAAFLGRHYAVSEATKTISLAPSPIALSITLNGKSDYVVRAGDTLNYVVTYRNNTNVGLRDAVLRVQFAGSAFDMATLETDGGVFNPVGNTVTWDTSVLSALRTVPIGGSGSVSVGVSAKDAASGFRVSDRNLTLKAAARMESPTVPDSISGDRTIGVAELVSKVAGQTALAALGYFRDANAGIINQGPVPPQVGVATQFSIHWTLKNFTTDLADAVIRAQLPANIRWTGVASSNDPTKPRYDDQTREAIWEIGNVAIGRGVINGQLEAVFQVEATPTVANKGRFMPLLGESVLTARDVFTESAVTDSAPGVTTELPDDATIGQNGGIVQ
ncbi:MAG: hypothetical protein HYS43_00385 [Candidatus Liptonbacteria bacterium]|nr:hypothetical protein [Candidatus Liptonbacteria bacterium]